MKSKALPLFLTLLTVAFIVLGCGKPSVNLGDGSTGNLLWGVVHYTYENQDLDKAVAYADKGLELHGAEARKQQNSLSNFPPTDPPAETYKYRTLNNVGLMVLVKGEALLEKGDRAGAEAAFSMLIRDFGYSQVQDLGEWGDYVSSVPRDPRGFIRLADVARTRLADIKKGEN